jgi:hypothetical protein
MLALAGCAAPAPPLFQAAWYLASVDAWEASPREKRAQPSADKVEGARPAIDRLYVGLLNQSERRQIVTAVVINGSADGQEPGWRLRGEFPLAPGEMLIRPAASFEKNRQPFPAACHVPVSVTVLLAPDDRSTPAEIRGRMPNFLPADWDRNCAR